MYRIECVTVKSERSDSFKDDYTNPDMNIQKNILHIGWQQYYSPSNKSEWFFKAASECLNVNSFEIAKSFCASPWFTAISSFFNFNRRFALHQNIDLLYNINLVSPCFKNSSFFCYLIGDGEVYQLKRLLGNQTLIMVDDVSSLPICRYNSQNLCN